MMKLNTVGTVFLVLAVLFAVLFPMLTPGENAALIALAQQGKKYVFNTEGPDTFDCSGLVMYAYAPMGLDIEHWANGISQDEQYMTIDSIGKVRVGDLIFFDTVKNKVPVDHVGIWIGDNRFVHASSSGKQVMVSEWNEDWQNVFVVAKRVMRVTDILPFSKKDTGETDTKA